MAIAYRSGSTAGSGDGASLTIPKPSGTLDNDILLTGLYREGGGGWTPPAGWNLLSEIRDGSNAQIWLAAYWRRVSSDGADYTWTLGASTWRTGIMLAFSGCKTTDSPVDVYGTYNVLDSSADAVVKCASVTTTVANTMLVALMANVNGANITAGTSGYTERVQLGGVEGWTLAQAASGASGVKTFSNVSTTRWATFNIALAEPLAASTSLVPPNLSRRMAHLLIR